MAYKIPRLRDRINRFTESVPRTEMQPHIAEIVAEDLKREEEDLQARHAAAQAKYGKNVEPLWRYKDRINQLMMGENREKLARAQSDIAEADKTIANTINREAAEQKLEAGRSYQDLVKRHIAGGGAMTIKDGKLVPETGVTEQDAERLKAIRGELGVIAKGIMEGKTYGQDTKALETQKAALESQMEGILRGGSRGTLPLETQTPGMFSFGGKTYTGTAGQIASRFGVGGQPEAQPVQGAGSFPQAVETQIINNTPDDQLLDDDLIQRVRPRLSAAGQKALDAKLNAVIKKKYGSDPTRIKVIRPKQYPKLDDKSIRQLVEKLRLYQRYPSKVKRLRDQIGDENMTLLYNYIQRMERKSPNVRMGGIKG